MSDPDTRAMTNDTDEQTDTRSFGTPTSGSQGTSRGEGNATRKRYETVVAEKRYFADRLERVYESVGMKWWIVGDDPEDEPIIPVIRRQRIIGVVQGAVVALIFGFGLGIVIMAAHHG